MRFSLAGRGSGIAVSIVMTGACLFTAGPASAQLVEAGTFSYTSDEGDFIGQGQPASYDTAAGDRLDVFGDSHDNGVDLEVNAANGDSWILLMGAPLGQTLAPGTYAGATDSGGANTPRLEFFGNGRGCNRSTGSFTVNAITWGPGGYVETLDATFDQHCEGVEPALHAQMHITNPPPPPALELGMTVATGTFDTLNGNATLQGTVNCNKAADTSVTGTITQDNKGVVARGTYFTQVHCTPDAPVAWTVTVSPTAFTAFQKGDAQTASQVNGVDADYGNNVTVNNSTVVKLTKPQNR